MNQLLLRIEDDEKKFFTPAIKKQLEVISDILCNFTVYGESVPDTLKKNIYKLFKKLGFEIYERRTNYCFNLWIKNHNFIFDALLVEIKSANVC